MKRRMPEPATGDLPIAKLLQENEFDPGFAETMLRVFKRVCQTLKVSDPNDPLCHTIACTVINFGSEGERDREELYQRTLNRLRHSNN
jgi:hypothetical protein